MPINAHGVDRETALHFAVYGNRKAMVEYLLRKGANVEARNGSGQTPLHGAAWKGFLDIAKVLLAAGANMEARTDNGLTPLDFAMDQKHGKMIELLGNHGAIRVAEEGKAP
jgi:cytohesin